MEQTIEIFCKDENEEYTFYHWKLNIGFRLNKDDKIHLEAFMKDDFDDDGRDIPDKIYKNEYWIVDEIYIDYNLRFIVILKPE